MKPAYETIQDAIRGEPIVQAGFKEGIPLPQIILNLANELHRYRHLPPCTCDTEGPSFCRRHELIPHD
jgi:hypothetical protein